MKPPAPSPPGRRVLVIGAGLSGLVAALELERRGFEVTVAEASARVGGRIRTWTPGPPGGPVGELGAMRIPAQHATVLEYVRRAGLAGDLVPFASAFSSPHGWYARAGARAPWPHAERLFALSDRVARSARPLAPDTLRFVTRLRAMHHAVAPEELRRRLDAELGAGLLAHLDTLDLRPYLPEGVPRVDIEGFFAQHPDVSQHLSATTVLFMRDVALETQPDLFTLAGGLERLPRALSRLLRRPPQLSAPVRSIERREHDVWVRYDAEEGEHGRAFDWAVCTAPFSALRHLELGGLDEDKLARIRDRRYCPTVKALWYCNEPFWAGDGAAEAGGASCLDAPNRQIYYPRARAGQPGAVLLVAYATGEDAKALTRLSAPERWSALRRHVATLHPELERPEVVRDQVFIDWDADPWIRGGCSVPWLDEVEQVSGELADVRSAEVARAAASAQGRLVFAGEHCSTLPAWLEGAARSALAVVEHITERA